MNAESKKNKPRGGGGGFSPPLVPSPHPLELDFSLNIQWAFTSVLISLYQILFDVPGQVSLIWKKEIKKYSIKTKIFKNDYFMRRGILSFSTK